MFVIGWEVQKINQVECTKIDFLITTRLKSETPTVLIPLVSSMSVLFFEGTFKFIPLFLGLRKVVS